MPDNDIKYMATAKYFLNRIHGKCSSRVFQHDSVSVPTNKNSFYNPLASFDLRMPGGFYKYFEIAHDQLI